MSENPVLLVIGYVWPEPDSSAAGSRMLQLIRAFQQDGYDVVYGSPAEASEHAPDLAALGIRAVPLALNCSSFDDFIIGLKPALVMFDRFMMEEQFGWRVEKACPQAVRILDTEDLHSLRHARAAQLKVQPQPLPVIPELAFRHSELAVREIAAILRCDVSLMISEFEMRYLTDYFSVPQTQLLYVPFMEQAPEPGSSPAFEERAHFVSIGNFRHEPNWDAVRYLKETLWPLIRKQLPKAELHIYGAYPPKKATQLQNAQQGFLVKGWAGDAQAVVRSARVMLAPLRFGAGLKGKLIDAARNGTPAVTTSIGAEGMYGERVCAHIADDAQAFADAAVALYQNADTWQALHEAGLGLLSERFLFSDHAPRLLQAVQRIVADPDAHRAPLFYSRMLRHHSLKSTQYMAQWIEAKNRLPPS
ncbi:glycosyltransferase [Thalassolituus sp. LLYu03]|uniref:glycosyltransferase n=1 Tax=Thalassolituus sp. LLYu03 TaxID=3421656 RepID=UPI003D2A5F3A